MACKMKMRNDGTNPWHANGPPSGGNHSQAGLVSKLLRQIAKAWNAERGY